MENHVPHTIHNTKRKNDEVFNMNAKKTKSNTVHCINSKRKNDEISHETEIKKIKLHIALCEYELKYGVCYAKIEGYCNGNCKVRL